MKIKLIKFNDNLITPTRAHYNDAGLDCYALEDIKIPSFNSIFFDLYSNGEDKGTIINLGFGIEIPNGYVGTIRPRSSMSAKGILTQIGTIDSGYRGEIKAVLINLNDKPILISKGDKICQLVIEPVILADLVEELGEERKTGGFGSTDR